MLDCTDRHARFFYRLLSKRAVLYTEMLVTASLIHGDRDKFLAYNSEEHPVVCQLGGSDPQELARCAQWVEAAGYDEVNINVGCPSDRVQSGMFGACLMAEPELVASGVRTMKQRVTIPVTVKTRIGIDDSEDYVFLKRFVEAVAEAGCETFIVHARKAWLKGLSPKQNRHVPPLRYEQVYRLKQELPQLRIIINGGITSLHQCLQHLQEVDGVMLGREVYDNPFILAEVDALLYGESAYAGSRFDFLSQLRPYLQQQLQQGQRLHSMTRHLLGLFHGQPAGKKWRRMISEQINRSNSNLEQLDRIIEQMQDFYARLSV